MYQFSRSIYRELGPQVDGQRCKDVAALRQQFLRSCEVTMERLATDRHYFAKPTRTLFNDVRALFPIGRSCASTGSSSATWRWRASTSRARPARA